MKSNSAFLWFFIIVGFITAAVGVAYFASGEGSRSTDQQNYTVFLQIPIGLVATLYGLSKRGDLSRE
jgi:H+/Cl- antiporter ClcA